MLPDAGDVAWVFLDQTEGTEQSGPRPGLVLSNRAYHEQSRRALICPISRRIAPWFFNVPLAEGMITKGWFWSTNSAPSTASLVCFS
jgi:mRNA interferase MazF